MAYEVNGIDDFLKKRGWDNSGGFLNKWKKKQPPEINIWLHTRRMPILLGQHNFPYIKVREDRQTGRVRKEVWSQSHNCHEKLEVLERQKKRDEEGRREVPPTVCGFCRMVEYVRWCVETGKVGIAAPVFVLEGDAETKVLHAGGFCGLFSEADGAELDEIRKAGIKKDEYWKEDCCASRKVLHCVVDNDEPGNGVQISIESIMMHGVMQDMVVDCVKSLGKEDGNPWAKPFCIQWEYVERAPLPWDRYKARRMPLIKITPEIEGLIRSNPPDLSSITDPFVTNTMRAIMERYCVLKDVPWDDIFKDSKGALPQAATAASGEAECPICGVGKECPHVACDACGKPMLESDPRCAACGKVYAALPAPPVAAATVPAATRTSDREVPF